jgi:cysteine desulfurase
VTYAPFPINLDSIAGAPMSPTVLAAWESAAQQAYSDPARMHHAGRQAGLLLESARSSIAKSLGVNPQQVFFAASASEALRVAIQGVYRQRRRVSTRIIASDIESMAVLQALGNLVGLEGAELVQVPALESGALNLEIMREVLPQGAAVACVQLANAEVGTRQPFPEVLQLARSQGVPVISDATGIISHENLPQDFDVLIAPARDWGGPPGVAIMITHGQFRWRPEEAPDRGWIGGFPDIPAAVAAAVALEESSQWEISARQSRQLIDEIRTSLAGMEMLGVHCTGDANNRLPHIVTFTIKGAAAGALVTELDKRGIYVASGSACTADSRMPSHVLHAMGIPHESSIRISLPSSCSPEEIETFLDVLPDAIKTVVSN